jgi:outer membrane biosynthesis protein TonB
VRVDVEVELTVATDGGVRDPRVVSGGDDARLAEQAVRAAGTARYRPRMADGQLVETTGVRLVQPYYVLRGDEPAAEPEAAPGASPATPPPQGPG